MVNVVFQSVFRVAYEKTHFSVFVIEVATVFEYPVKLFIFKRLWRLYLNFKVTHPEQFIILWYFALFQPPTQAVEPHYFTHLFIHFSCFPLK